MMDPTQAKIVSVTIHIMAFLTAWFIGYCIGWHECAKWCDKGRRARRRRLHRDAMDAWDGRDV